jgi:hypothetical protein
LSPGKPEKRDGEPAKGEHSNPNPDTGLELAILPIVRMHGIITNMDSEISSADYSQCIVIADMSIYISHIH